MLRLLRHFPSYCESRPPSPHGRHAPVHIFPGYFILPVYAFSVLRISEVRIGCSWFSLLPLFFLHPLLRHDVPITNHRRQWPLMIHTHHWSLTFTSLSFPFFALLCMYYLIVLLCFINRKWLLNIISGKGGCLSKETWSCNRFSFLLDVFSSASLVSDETKHVAYSV